MTTKIADSELEIMRVLWRAGRPLSFTEIRTALQSTTTWSKSTIQTFITRLREKGAISSHEHYVTLFAPTITEEDYLKVEGQNFIDKLFGGSAKNLVAALCRNGQLAEEDVNELHSFFQMGGDSK